MLLIENFVLAWNNSLGKTVSQQGLIYSKASQSLCWVGVVSLWIIELLYCLSHFLGVLMISTTGNLLNNVAGALYFLNGNSVLHFRATLVTLCEMHLTMKKVSGRKISVKLSYKHNQTQGMIFFLTLSYSVISKVSNKTSKWWTYNFTILIAVKWVKYNSKWHVFL